MKVWRKVRNILALAMILAAVHATAVLAETTVSITGGENLQVGSPVAVTVTLQNDSAMEESDLFISYDSTLMQFVSGDDAEVQSDGRIRIRWAYDDPATQKIWTLQFNAVAAGSGTVSAADVWVRDTDGNTDAGVTVNAGTVNISEAGQTAAADQNAAAASAQPAADAETAGQDPALAALAEQIASDGTMSCLIGTEKWIVTEEFGNDILLPHFVETTQFYKGVEVTAGKLNNAEYYILLVHSEDGSQEKFVRYDQETKTFSDIIRLEQGEDCALFMLDPPEDAIPDTFTETTYEGYRAWQLPASDPADEFAADPSDFYLFYGYNQDGADGWFLFDSVTGGFTRYVETTPVATVAADTAGANGTDSSMVTRYNNLLSRFDFMVTCIKYVAIALIALLLILLVVNLTDKGDDNAKKKDKKKEKQEKKEKKQDKKQEKQDKKQEKQDEQDKKTDTPVKKAEAVQTKKADAPVKEKMDPMPPETATKAQKADVVQETKKMDKVKPAAKTEKVDTPVKKPAAVPAGKLADPEKDADDFVDDYIEEEDLSAPQNAQEEKTIGVLKPVVKKSETGKEADRSMQDSIEELSRQMQEPMSGEKSTADASELDELTFIDLDEN